MEYANDKYYAGLRFDRLSPADFPSSSTHLLRYKHASHKGEYLPDATTL